MDSTGDSNAGRESIPRDPEARGEQWQGNIWGTSGYFFVAGCIIMLFMNFNDHERSL